MKYLFLKSNGCLPWPFYNYEKIILITWLFYLCYFEGLLKDDKEDMLSNCIMHSLNYVMEAGQVVTFIKALT